MDSVEEQILSYPHLSIEEQRDVDAYVEDHPEWAPLLQSVRSLEALGRTGREASDPFLRTYVVHRYFRSGEVSTPLREAFQRLEQRLDDDPELQARADALRERLAEREAGLDPVSHFEELTGHSLSQEDASNASTSASPSTVRDTTRGSEGAADPSLLDQLLSLPLALRGIGAAVAILLGTYAALFVASEASQSTTDRLAAVTVSDQMVESYYSTNTRSAAPATDTLTVDDLYLEALSSLRSARTSTLGLFPSYNPDSLRKAERRLKEVLDRTDDGSFLALEAHFYLGKVYLAQDRIGPAQKRFETVIDQDGRRADEAEEILKTLREASASESTPTSTS